VENALSFENFQCGMRSERMIMKCVERCRDCVPFTATAYGKNVEKLTNTTILTYLLTYLLRGTESFLRS